MSPANLGKRSKEITFIFPFSKLLRSLKFSYGLNVPTKIKFLFEDSKVFSSGIEVTESKISTLFVILILSSINFPPTSHKRH